MTIIIKQKVITSTEDYRSEIIITEDGKKIFEVNDGEPEDNTLHRNFSSCHSVIDILKKMYEYGQSGTVVKFEEEEIEE